MASPLPAVTEVVTLDGSTQPGFADVPVVALDGAAAGAGADGLTVRAEGVTVRGLAVYGFDGDGIDIADKGKVRVEGCYLGVDPVAGTAVGNGGAGVRIGSAGNTVGGARDQPQHVPATLLGRLGATPVAAVDLFGRQVRDNW